MTASGGWEDRFDEEPVFVGFKEVPSKIDQLDRIAKESGRSRSSLVREAIQMLLDEGVRPQAA